MINSLESGVKVEEGGFTASTEQGKFISLKRLF